MHDLEFPNIVEFISQSYLMQGNALLHTWAHCLLDDTTSWHLINGEPSMTSAASYAVAHLHHVRGKNNRKMDGNHSKPASNILGCASSVIVLLRCTAC